MNRYHRSFAALLATITVMSGTVAAGAQSAPTAFTAPPAAEHEHRGLAKLVKDLNLTTDQKSRFKSLISDMREHAKKIKSDASLTPDQQKEQIKALRQDMRKQVVSLLTPAQRAKLKTLHQQREAEKKKDAEK